MDPGYRKRQEIHTDIKDNEAYRCAIGSLLYLATNTRPNIAVGASILARHVSDPTEADWVEVKRISRYLKHTKQKKMKLGNTEEQQSHSLTVFVDADWGEDVEERKSNIGRFFRYLGVTITWTSQKQSMVTLSSTEAEYIALAEALQEAIWTRRLLVDLNQTFLDQLLFLRTIKTVSDNNITKNQAHEQSTLISSITVFVTYTVLGMLTSSITVFVTYTVLGILTSSITVFVTYTILGILTSSITVCDLYRSGDTDIKYHCVCDLYSSGDTDIKYCPSEQMTADLLNKPLEAVKTVVNIELV